MSAMAERDIRARGVSEGKAEAKPTVKDMKGLVDPDWCTGCGDFGVLTALKQAQEPPRSLFVEPWRTCNLACTYCYAESDPSHTRRIDDARCMAIEAQLKYRARGPSWRTRYV